MLRATWTTRRKPRVQKEALPGDEEDIWGGKFFSDKKPLRRLKKEIPTILWLRKVILLAAVLLCSTFLVDYSWSELMWCPLNKEGSWTECHILNAISLIATSTILYLSCFSCELPLTPVSKCFLLPFIFNLPHSYTLYVQPGSLHVTGLTLLLLLHIPICKFYPMQ